MGDRKRILSVGPWAWGTANVNQRYYELSRRFTLVRQVLLPPWRGMARIVPLIVRSLAGSYEFLYCPQVSLLTLWKGLVIVDLDDPSFSPREVDLLNDPRVLTVVTTTERLKAGLIARGVRSPVEVLPSGFSQGDLDDGIASKIGARHNPARHPVVGYAGARLEVSGANDISLLLEAMERIWSKVPDAQLWMLGLPAPAVRRWSAGRSGVRLFGWIHRRHLLNFMRNFTVATYPRTHDAGGFFRVKLIEYMGCGVPTVAARNPETEIIQRARAGLVAEGTYDFAAAILRLLTDEQLRATLGESGRRFAAGYDWDALTRSYEQRIFVPLVSG